MRYPTTERITVRFPGKQLDSLDQMVEEGAFPSRSEAIRAAVRQELSDGDSEERVLKRP